MNRFFFFFFLSKSILGRKFQIKLYLKLYKEIDNNNNLIE